jgi:hypothetical protein
MLFTSLLSYVLLCFSVSLPAAGKSVVICSLCEHLRIHQRDSARTVPLYDLLCLIVLLSLSKYGLIALCSPLRFRDDLLSWRWLLSLSKYFANSYSMFLPLCLLGDLFSMISLCLCCLKCSRPSQRLITPDTPPLFPSSKNRCRCAPARS